MPFEQYRLRSQIVDAVQWQPGMELSDVWPMLRGNGHVFSNVCPHCRRPQEDHGITHGSTRVCPGDYIVRHGSNVRAYKPEDFEKYFEAMDPSVHQRRFRARDILAILNDKNVIVGLSAGAATALEEGHRFVDAAVVQIDGYDRHELLEYLTQRLARPADEAPHSLTPDVMP